VNFILKLFVWHLTNVLCLIILVNLMQTEIVIMMRMMILK